MINELKQAIRFMDLKIRMLEMNEAPDISLQQEIWILEQIRLLN